MLLPGSGTYFLEVSAHVSLKVATKVCLRVKKNSENLYFLVVFLKEKRKSVTKEIEVSLRNLLYFFQLHIFLKKVHVFHWKQPPKGFLEVKKLWKFRFYSCSSKTKTEECNQKIWNFSAKSGMPLPGSATYSLEVGARLSLKVVTKGCFRGKNNSENLDFTVIYVKQTRRSATKNF